MKNEDQNFSLFNYVNEQQNEVEKLEEQLHQLEEEEKKFTQVQEYMMNLFARRTIAREIPRRVKESYEWVSTAVATLLSTHGRIELPTRRYVRENNTPRGKSTFQEFHA